MITKAESRTGVHVQLEDIESYIHEGTANGVQRKVRIKYVSGTIYGEQQLEDITYTISGFIIRKSDDKPGYIRAGFPMQFKDLPLTVQSSIRAAVFQERTLHGVVKR